MIRQKLAMQPTCRLVPRLLLLCPQITHFLGRDFLWTMDRDKNGHDGLNGQEWTAEWTMDDGQWTMDRDYVAPFRANPNIADPTDLLDPSDPTDLSEKATDQITNSRAILSVEAATLQIFRTIAQNLLFWKGFSKNRCASYWL
jgi:hypothetical protein